MRWLASVLLQFIVALGVAPATAAARAHEPAAPHAEPPTAVPARLQRGYLRVEGVERAALVEALVLRVPHLAFEPFEVAAGVEGGEGVVFVELRRRPASDPSFTLTIVASDGRAFDRRVEVGRDDEETVRLLASTVANLLLAIEAGSAVADRGDVPLPTAVVTPPAPECACECPAAPACPVAMPGVEAEPVVVPPTPRLELGPAASAVTVLGLGAPAAADRFAAFGASVGVHARLRRGAFFGAELRTSGRGQAAGHRLVRQRFALGAGYALRRGTWSLETSLWATAEPWWFVGAPIDPRPRPLWGGLVRLAPSLHQPLDLRGRRVGLTVGPVIELAASAQLIDGEDPRIGLVVVEDGRGVLGRSRVGGLELATGVSCTLWFGAPR